MKDFSFVFSFFHDACIIFYLNFCLSECNSNSFTSIDTTKKSIHGSDGSSTRCCNSEY